MSTLRVANEPVLSSLSLQILRLKNLPGKYNMISPLDHQTGCRTLAQPLPTDPTRSFDLPPQIPEYLNSIWTLRFIGFNAPTAELIWKHYDLISSESLPMVSSSASTAFGQARNQAEHHLLHVAKTHLRTKAEMTMDTNCSVNQAMAAMGLGQELRDAVMNYALDLLRGVEGADAMLKDTTNLEGWTVAVVEKRWFSLADLDREIIRQRMKENKNL